MQNFDWVQVSTDKLSGWAATPYPLTRAFKARHPGVVPVEYFQAVREYGSGQSMKVHSVLMSDSSWWHMTGTDGSWRCRPTRP